MKYFVICSIISILLISSCTKNCSSQKDSTLPSLRIGTNPTFPPFESIDEKGELVGFDIDLGRALAKELNMQAVFKEFDFDALILALKKNQIDLVLAGMSITESRKKEITMIPYQGKALTHVALLFWEKVNEPVNNFEDLKNLSQKNNLAVTVQAGHFLEGFLKELNLNLKTLSGPPEQVIDIKYRKSLAAAMDQSGGESLAAKHPGLKLVSLELPKEKWDLGNGIGIKKENQELIKKVEQAVARLKENGTIKALESKWIGGEE